MPPLGLPPDLLQRCWFLAGPTAVGKTAAAIVLAERLPIPAEILAMDSMTIYRGMDIGTAKPSAAEQAQVPHHLLNLRDPSEPYTTAEYLRDAEQRVREILDRRRTPLFVGGTGLYLRALLRGVCDAPPADAALRRTLAEEAQSVGPEALHQRLATVDPLTAARLPPQDLRRVIRALEVFQLTGTPLSQQQRESPLPIEQRPRHVYWLHPPRAMLYDRINRRVAAMLAVGLVEEVTRLRNSSTGIGQTAAQALGYKEILESLDNRCSLAEAAEQIRTRTRQFAKRQHTWFRNLVECHEVVLLDHANAEQIAAAILAVALASSQCSH